MSKCKPKDVICLLVILLETTGAEWSYPSVSEPLSWDSYTNCKYGNFQSPININREDTKYEKFQIEITVPNYALYEVEIYKNVTLMYTLMVDGEGNYNPTTLDWLRGDGVNPDSQFYDLNHFEIHWSDVSNNGSEHSINNIFGVAEIQFYYYNIKKGKSFQELKGEKDGILVQAYILKVGPKPDLNQLFNFSFSEDGKERLVLDLSNIITLDQKSEFYNYVGSITYPECEENVQWLISNEPIDITQEQFTKLLSLRSNGTRSNVRTQISSTDRQVLRSFDKENAAMSLRSIISVKAVALTSVFLVFMII